MSYYNAFNEISKASDYIFKVLNRPSAHIFQDITVLNIKNTSEFLKPVRLSRTNFRQIRT